MLRTQIFTPNEIHIGTISHVLHNCLLGRVWSFSGARDVIHKFVMSSNMKSGPKQQHWQIHFPSLQLGQDWDKPTSIAHLKMPEADEGSVASLNPLGTWGCPQHVRARPSFSVELCLVIAVCLNTLRISRSVRMFICSF